MPRITHIALAFLFLLAGCSNSDEQPKTDISALPLGYLNSSMPTAPVDDDPPGTLACGRLAVAVRDATLMDPGVVDGIAAGAVSADAPVLDAAQRLAHAYTAAVAAHGAATEPDAIAAVTAAAADMSGVCADSGLQPSVG